MHRQFCVFWTPSESCWSHKSQVPLLKLKWQGAKSTVPSSSNDGTHVRAGRKRFAWLSIESNLVGDACCKPSSMKTNWYCNCSKDKDCIAETMRSAMKKICSAPLVAKPTKSSKSNQRGFVFCLFFFILTRSVKKLSTWNSCFQFLQLKFNPGGWTFWTFCNCLNCNLPCLMMAQESDSGSQNVIDNDERSVTARVLCRKSSSCSHRMGHHMICV